MAYLVLVRHGVCEGNSKGEWVGWSDSPITTAGIKEAQDAGKLLADIRFSVAYSSDLLRTKQTLHFILKTLHEENIPIIESKEMKERNYGDYTGKNKWEVKNQVGEVEFTNIRRGWDYPIPNGESLKQVYDRSVPYYQQSVLPHLVSGKNVLIVGSGNSLRALIKYLEHISDQDIARLEIATGEVLVYTLDATGNMVRKEKRTQKPNTV